MWTEKYRPKTVDDIVGQDDNISELKELIRKHPKSIPPLLFHGQQGTGKTATALAIAQDLKANLVEINASDQRGIDDVREIVVPAMRYVLHGYKVIFMEEGDKLTHDSQTALRRPLEMYTSPIVILCCNYPDNLIDPFRSRFREFVFRPLDVDAIAERLRYIAEREGLSISIDDIREIATYSKGDMRRAIITLEGAGGKVNKRMSELERIAQQYR